MSVFGDMFTGHALTHLMEQRGVTVTYNTSEVTAIVGAVKMANRADSTGFTHRQTRHVTVALTDVSDPVINDTVTIGSDEWVVDEIIAITESYAKVLCVLNPQASIHHSGYIR